jgi:NAD(P)-dependent dehydrogenase (short-subunit alcohol dehydrogenase family)
MDGEVMPLEPKLRGRVALVTGAARGLGRGIALRLARLGADVAIADVNLAAAKEFNETLSAPTVMDECKGLGVNSIGIEGDVSRKDHVTAMTERIVKELGSLDILVNVAGGVLRPADRGAPSVMSEDDYRFIMDINLTSMIFCSQAAVAAMRKKNWGRIVSISSQAGLRGGTFAAHYCVAKAGVTHFTRCLAGEVGPWGITVNCIAPAYVNTSRALAQFPDRQDLARTIPLRRLGEPDDVAKAVEFFVTDLGDYVTGQCLPVCGGLVLSPS